jgi:hypothetical protein
LAGPFLNEQIKAEERFPSYVQGTTPQLILFLSSIPDILNSKFNYITLRRADIAALNLYPEVHKST